MKLRVLYHGHCFDGVASAATFTRFYKERINPDAEVNYTGLLHRPGNLFDLDMFDSDENAIVDFKYAASEKLTWWFDHHESAFLTPEDEAHFRADKSGRKFLDATRKSCTEFIADVAHERFGFDTTPIESLVHWAHIIDGALYESPAQCVELKEPALQLMQVIEADPDDAIYRTDHSRSHRRSRWKRWRPARKCSAVFNRYSSNISKRWKQSDEKRRARMLSCSLIWLTRVTRDSTSSFRTTCIRKRLIQWR